MKIRTHICVWRLVSSNGTQSLAEAVVEDMANILGGSCNDIFDFNSVGSDWFLQ